MTQTDDLCWIKNGLVGMIGISEYDELTNLDGVVSDYNNIINTFVKLYKYKILYKLNDNSLVYTNNINEINTEKNNFKLKWSDKDIDIYLEELREKLISNKHDSILLFVSSHGDDNDGNPQIITSDGETVDITFIRTMFKPEGTIWVESHEEKENETKYLFRIPKIFFVDMCRGQIKAKITKLNDNYNDDNSKIKINENENENERNEESDDSSDEESRRIDGKETGKYSSQDANFCTIYANTRGYAVAGSSKGAAFLLSVCKIFNDKISVRVNDLDNLIRKIRKETKAEATLDTNLFNMTQTVESVSTMEKQIYFKIQLEYNICFDIEIHQKRKKKTQFKKIKNDINNTNDNKCHTDKCVEVMSDCMILFLNTINRLRNLHYSDLQLATVQKKWFSANGFSNRYQNKLKQINFKLTLINTKFK